MRTRNQHHIRNTKSQHRAAERKKIPKTIREDRRHILKTVAQEIVDALECLGKSQYGCRTNIFNKHKKVHDWLVISNVDYYIRKIKSNITKNQESSKNLEVEFEEEAILEEIPAKASIASIELKKSAGRPKESSRGEKVYHNNTYHDAMIEACRRYTIQTK